jgi:uncharacterized protein with HEPN domain
MRRERLYLLDILDAADALNRFVAGKSREEFLTDEVLQSAVLQKLTVIGEAAARLSRELHARHPDIEWKEIIGFRNIAVHAYFGMQWPMVWKAATSDAPELRPKIERVLAVEFPAEPEQPHNC